MSSPLVAAALTLDERDLAVAALRELAGRRTGTERARALELATVLVAAISTSDVAVRVALLDDDFEQPPVPARRAER